MFALRRHSKDRNTLESCLNSSLSLFWVKVQSIGCFLLLLGEVMRVFCKECGQRGRITKTNRLSDEVSDLYCQCTDAECGHSWVATLSFTHTLSPSARTTNQLVLSLMGSLTPEGRQLVLKGLGAQ